MNRKTVIVAMLLTSAVCFSQESSTVFNFLRLPISAHAAALGGDNITLSDDDATLVFHNPALVNEVSDRTLNLNMMTYMQGTVTGSATFVRQAGERGTWAVSGRYMSYGEMKEMNAVGEQTGTFTPRDIAVGGTFAYALTDHLSGGITAKFIASYIDQYSSTGAGIDLGLNWFSGESEWSVSAVARNLGGQLSAYDDEFERIPFDLQLGVSKRLTGSPLRFHATMVRLTDWQYGIGKHFVLGLDLILGNQFYLAAGYNPLRTAEMKVTADEEESSHGAGLSLGGGLTLERFKLHIAYAKYHVSSSSLLINISYSL